MNNMTVIMKNDNGVYEVSVNGIPAIRTENVKDAVEFMENALRGDDKK